MERIYILQSRDQKTGNYKKPSIRVVVLSLDDNFLSSNTETIIDDGEEHGWD